VISAPRWALRIARRWAPWLAIAAAIAGCDSNHERELQAWMDEARRTTPPIRETLTEPKRFQPFRYQPGDAPDPFSQSKLLGALEKAAERSASGLKPDLTRRREPLEAFTLETLRLVGHLQKGDVNVALLQAEKLVYQVRVGNYIGQNFGRVIRISETELGLKELVQDAVGDWIERETSMRLQESTR
jgi:type IV pilus assembly protein PilP